MSNKQVSIERPEALKDTPPEVQQYVRAMEMLGFTPAQEVVSPWNPRTWPVGQWVTVVLFLGSLFLWSFKSGGNWEQVENRLQAMENRQSQYETIYARRDLLEQQMGYVVTGLNELKVKVDQLMMSSSRGGGE